MNTFSNGPKFVTIQTPFPCLGESWGGDSATKQGRKDSSFLKKRSKRLYESGLSLSGKAEAKLKKVFCFFFSKKKIFLSDSDLVSTR